MWTRLAAALALVIAVAPPALADGAGDKQDIPANARALAERGRKHHEAGEYAAAIAAFTEAYALAPSPGLLFNLAQSYRLAGHCDDASTMYKRFLATEPPPEPRALAETQLIAMDQCVEALRPVRLPPPPAPVTAPPAREPDTTTSHHATLVRDTGLGIGVVGGVALVGALVFELRAHSDSQTVSNTYAHGGAGSTIADVDSRGRHDAAVADALGITGVVAVGAGVALYWMGTRESRASHVAVVPTTRGAQVAAAWRF